MRRGAFTLVELIVVMLLTVLLVASAGTFMRTVAAAREVATNQLQGRQEAMAALRTITAALRNGYRPVSDDDQLFIGAVDPSDSTPASRVRFRTIERKVIRSGQPESDVHEVEFFIRERDGKPTLMRRTDPTKNLPPDGGGVVEPLSQQVVGLDLQYLDGGKWNDRWPEDLKRWPTAVNVRLIYHAEPDGKRLENVSAIVSLPWFDAENTIGAAGSSPQ